MKREFLSPSLPVGKNENNPQTIRQNQFDIAYNLRNLNMSICYRVQTNGL